MEIVSLRSSAELRRRSVIRFRCPNASWARARLGVICRLVHPRDFAAKLEDGLSRSKLILLRRRARIAGEVWTYQRLVGMPGAWPCVHEDSVSGKGPG